MIKLHKVFGIHRIDIEHHEIFDIIGDLVALVKHSRNRQVICEKAGYLVHKFKNHYSTEEMFKLRSAYPHYAAHKEQHESLLVFLEGKIRNALCDSLAVAPDHHDFQYISDWFSNHLLLQDKKLCAFLQESNCCSAELFSPANENTNKRLHTRLYLKINALLRLADGTKLRGIINNISFSGLDFHCPQPPFAAVGQSCHLIRLFPEQNPDGFAIEFACKMTRMDNDRVGLKFLSANESVYRWFEDFMRHHYVKPNHLLKEVRKHAPMQIKDNAPMMVSPHQPSEELAP